MRIGVMQPYFFPYIGYWQLLNHVQKYVIFDDVNYINRGWINRNRIIDGKGGTRYINVYLKDASQNKHINEIMTLNDRTMIEKNKTILKQIYKNAPFFDDVYPIIEKVFNQEETNIAVYNGNLISIVCDYLGIETELLYSSEIVKNNDLKGQDKIIEICGLLNGTEYYNAIGGRELYDGKKFERNNLKLFFVQCNEVRYKQFDNDFIPNLSIIDVMMFNARDEVQKMLSDFSLINAK